MNVEFPLKFANTILIYFLIFSIIFSGFGVSFLQVRLIYAILGGLLLFFRPRIRFFKIFLCLFPVILYSLIIGLSHATNDFSLALSELKDFSYFFAAYFVVTMVALSTKRSGMNLFYYLCEIYVYAVLFQLLLGLCMYLNPSLFDFLNSLVYARNDEKIMGTYQNRIVLFGETNFFGAGAIICVALLLIVFLIDSEFWKLNLKTGFLLLSFLVAGAMASRTVLLGFGFAMLYGLCSIKRFRFRDFLKITLGGACVIACALWLLPESLFRFGFEHFYHLSEESEFRSASTDQLYEMYERYPTNLSTYFWGDGKWGTMFEYYMATDVGYLRQIFYWGIPGTLLFFLVQYRLTRQIPEEYQKTTLRKLCNCLFLLLLVLNTKGFLNLNGMGGGILALVAVFPLVGSGRAREKPKSLSDSGCFPNKVRKF